MLSKMILLICLAFVAFARDISFPPVAAVHPLQYIIGGSANLDDIDIVTGSQFSGLTTFAHLPYINCFADGPIDEKYDIAILGAPFDTVSTSEWLS